MTDSDGNPKGGNAVPSRSDDSAGRKASANLARMTPNTTGAVSPNPSVVEAVQRLYDNLSSAPFDAEKCFVSLDDHRTLVAGFTHLLAALNKDQAAQ